MYQSHNPLESGAYIDFKPLKDKGYFHYNQIFLILYQSLMSIQPHIFNIIPEFTANVILCSHMPTSILFNILRGKFTY